MIDFNLIPVMPEIFLAIIAMGLLITGVTIGNSSTRVTSWAAMLGLGVTFLIVMSVPDAKQTVLNGMFVFDHFAGFIKLVIIIGLIAALALSIKYLEQEQIARFEYPVLVLFAGLGMMMMVSANNLLSLYVGLELQSLSLYVLAAIKRNSVKSSEAGIKYFLLGALSSGMLLFGISLIYGFSGSIDFGVIRETLANLSQIPIGVTIGMVFVLAGLAFKISAVPFHMWTPDVYEGAPLSVTALFAIVPKVAAIALLIRLLFEPFMPAHDQWMQIIYFVSLASMVVGAFAGIAQSNVKRLLAYSSIGNMGYALIGIVVGTADGISATIIYIVIYMIMTAGTFSIVMCMRRNDMALEGISDLSGLSKNSPLLAYVLALLMFSMSGIPPMAGFFGKMIVFEAAVESEYYVLATLGILTSVVAAYYYLRIIKVMFFDEPEDEFDRNTSVARQAVMFASIIFVMFFVLTPNWLIESAQAAAGSLFP